MIYVHLTFIPEIFINLRKLSSFFVFSVLKEVDNLSYELKYIYS